MTIPNSINLAQYTPVTGRLVLVTPDMAREWLTYNNINRRIRRPVVALYAAIMRANHWRATHQGIAFSSTNLIDGQHRLLAIIELNISQWMMVFVEQQDDTFGVLDHGYNRTLRDDLREDSRIVDPATFIHRLLNGRHVGPTAFEVQAVLRSMRDPLHAILNASGTSAKDRGVAPLRAAAALRWISANAPDRAYIVGQWHAWLTLDIPAMSPRVQGMLKRIDTGFSSKDPGSVSEMRTAIGWIGLNPKRRSQKKVIVHNLSEVLEEMREAFRDSQEVPNA
ncbi:hypothetical protein [Sandarakinorhabdus sp.]|uniref:hypothetical protein n=1 Tax=Sandarakinorhabdus sp. TaxID=1916663 RepID=UPI003567C8C3